LLNWVKKKTSTFVFGSNDKFYYCAKSFPGLFLI
jgi:hypothetical protein